MAAVVFLGDSPRVVVVAAMGYCAQHREGNPAAPIKKLHDVDNTYPPSSKPSQVCLTERLKRHVKRIRLVGSGPFHENTRRKVGSFTQARELGSNP